MIELVGNSGKSEVFEILIYHYDMGIVLVDYFPICGDNIFIFPKIYTAQDVKYFIIGKYYNNELKSKILIYSNLYPYDYGFLELKLAFSELEDEYNVKILFMHK